MGDTELVGSGESGPGAEGSCSAEEAEMMRRWAVAVLVVAIACSSCSYTRKVNVERPRRVPPRAGRWGWGPPPRHGRDGHREADRRREAMHREHEHRREAMRHEQERRREQQMHREHDRDRRGGARRDRDGDRDRDRRGDARRDRDGDRDRSRGSRDRDRDGE